MVSDSVRQFVSEHISSHEKLAVLLFLHRAGAAPSSIPEIAAGLGCPESLVEESVRDLAAVGVVAATDGRYVFQPCSMELAGIVAAVVQLHDEDLSELIEIMNSRAIGRVRVAAAERFRLTLPGTGGDE